MYSQESPNVKVIQCMFVSLSLTHAHEKDITYLDIRYHFTLKYKIPQGVVVQFFNTKQENEACTYSNPILTTQLVTVRSVIYGLANKKTTHFLKLAVHVTDCKSLNCVSCSQKASQGQDTQNATPTTSSSPSINGTMIYEGSLGSLDESNASPITCNHVFGSNAIACLVSIMVAIWQLS